MAVRLLFVFAKEPRPGQVKTRLCPPLSPAEAAACQKAFLVDLLARIKRLPDVTVVLCAAPDTGTPELSALAEREGIPLRPQGPGDLGKRMRRVLEGAERQDAAAVILGADSPDVPLEALAEAFDWLEKPGVVLGPSRDGGYYTIGCRGQVPPLFELDAPWGSAGVFAESVERTRAAQSRLLVLAPWDDVDDAAGLSRLDARMRARIAEGEKEDLAATRAALDSLASSPRRGPRQ